MFFARVCFLASLSLFFPLSSLRTNKQTLNSFLFNENTRVSSSKSVKSLINYQIYRSQRCFRRKNQTFRGTLILLSHLFFFVFFLFERFLFERERERHFFVSARERANALGRTQRERERFVFNKRKCPPPRNKNGNKINSLF